MGIEFTERVLQTRVPRIGPPGGWVEVTLHWRQDPLTGRSGRIFEGAKFQPTTRPDLTGLSATPPFCPFCAAHIETATSTFPAELSAEGRIRRGRAVVVPNVLAYSTHSAVGVYDPARHFTDLDALDADLLADALDAMCEHARAVRRFDPEATWSSINANYLPPSGSSLVHPHLQSAHDPCGLSTQRLLVSRSAEWPEHQSYWSALVGQEQDGPRWVGRTGPVSWFTPFAPSGFHEVWGLVSGVTDVVELDRDHTTALGAGLSRIFSAYREMNLTSFNFSVMGGGPDARPDRYTLLVRVVSRSNAESMYRSDVTYFEKLYDEALVDQLPEDVAAAVRPRF